MLHQIWGQNSDRDWVLCLIFGEQVQERYNDFKTIAEECGDDEDILKHLRTSKTYLL